jgi:hypothetical protein
MHAALSGGHRKTYEHLFQHPMPQNLDWRDVLSMLNALPDATVDEAHDGHVKLTRSGQSITLRRPRGKDFSDKAELASLKHFLERTDAPAEAGPAAPAGTHLLVVIDHSEARVYSAEMRGAVPHQIKPYDPFGYRRDLRNVENDGNGQRRPELKSYYEAVAKTLRGAEQILLFGTGTGASSAMDHLLAELKQHHHAVAEKVIGSVTVDEKHLTDDQLLAKAREFFAAR